MSPRLLPFLILMVLSASRLTAQYREADSLRILGITLIDQGKPDEAWAVLEEGHTKFPQFSAFRYEQAYIRYAQGRYAEARDILEKLIDKPDAQDRYFQLLGNAYDLIGDPEKGIATYEKGLERFPESGYLFLELGVMAEKAEEYEKAVNYWERGLTVQPTYSSNFYHAGRLFLMTPERGWGLLYGETFLALEPGTQRATSMRAMLWEGYKDAFEFAGTVESSEEERGSEEMSLGSVRLFRENLMLVDEEGTARMPLTMILEMSSMMGALPILMAGPPLTVARLHEFRAALLDSWYENEEASGHFDLTLFDYQRRLRDAGHLEAYNHLLVLCEETSAEVKAWVEAHPGAFEAMIEWLQENPYPADVNPFSRLTIKGMPMASNSEEEE